MTKPTPDMQGAQEATSKPKRTRRGNHDGAVFKYKGKWAAQMTVPDGRRKTYYGATEREVKAKLKAGLRDLDRGQKPADTRRKTAEFLEDWLIIARLTVRPRTYANYAQLVRRYAVPALGKVPVVRVSAEQVQQLYATMLEQGLSPTTVHHLHAVLHRAFAQARKFKIITENPCELVDAPRMAHHEMQTLSPERVRTFLVAAAGHRCEALFTLAVTTGMRQGELLGLHWADVDLTAGSVQVRTSLQRGEHGVVLGMPKTEKSRRKIELTEIALDALRRHRARQVEERLLLGPDWHEHDLVFPNGIGKPAAAGHILQREFYPLLERAKLPHIRFHDLRHTAATLMMLQGTPPKVVSEMLGHSQTGITMDLYSHVTPTMHRDAVTALNRLLKG
jgi:integrase